MIAPLLEPNPNYEYGILYDRHRDNPHRVGMTEEEAYQWIGEWVEMGGKRETFSVIRRTLGQWERA